MKLRSLIVAKKSSVKAGEWRRGEIPRPLWPSRRAKAKAYKFGPQYQWRIVAYYAAGLECRLRILLNLDKQIFRATMAVMQEGDTVILCDYEFHASEPGWHCHARCDDLSEVNASTNRFGSRRLPATRSFHRRPEFAFRKVELSEVTAFNAAVEFFKLDRTEGLI